MAPYEESGFYNQFPTDDDGDHIVPVGLLPDVLWDYYKILSIGLLHQNHEYKLENCYAILPNINAVPIARDVFINCKLIDNEKVFLAVCEAVKDNSKPTDWVTFLTYHR